MGAKGFIPVLIILLFMPRPAPAQVLDSLRTSISQKGRASLTGGFSTKQTFIDGFKSPIFTAKIGVDFNDHLRIGGGVSFLKAAPYDSLADQEPFIYKKVITDTSGPHIIPSSLRFAYLNYYVEYVFYRTKRWEFSIPLHIGIGNSYYEYSYNKQLIRENSKTIILYEPLISGHYKIFRWFGVGADIGYRFMIRNNKAIGGRFNSPVYNFKTIIFFGTLYRMVFPKKE